jgi:hypothetical protein
MVTDMQKNILLKAPGILLGCLLLFAPCLVAGKGRIPVPPLILKTNLLYDIAATPNLEMEVPVGRRWSVNGEFQHGWWLRKDNTFCWQLEALSLEGRYYPDGHGGGSRSGWFAGAFLGAGVHDFQPGKQILTVFEFPAIMRNDRGIQGDFYFAGLSVGYARWLPHSPWGLEFSIGGGWLTNTYTPYKVQYDKLIRQGADMRFTGIIPLKLKVSLMYRLEFKQEIKKRNTR